MLLFDQLNETEQIGWQEFIDQFNADDITKLKAWLNSFILSMNNQSVDATEK